MPKTKKLSYAKRRERKNEARRVKIDNCNESGPGKVLGVDSQPIIIIPDDDVRINVQDTLRENRERIKACIFNIKQELDDECINAFLKVLAMNTSFKPQDPLFYQGIQWYQRVNTDKDIQILYGGDIGVNLIGHWTCIYYDGSIVHVYDSLHRELLPFQQEILKCLYQEYSLVYEKVQIQPDGVSCGVFACAIAATLAQGQDPTTVRYLVDDDGHFKSTLTMRQHLIKILDQEMLIPFPAMDLRTSLCTLQQQPNALPIAVNQEGIKPNVAAQSNRTYASVCRAVPKKPSIITEVPSAKSIQKCIPPTTNDQKLNSRVEVKKEWWKNYKDTINRNRRTAERQSGTSENKKAKKRANYAVNAAAIKHIKKAKYAANPETKRTYEKRKYVANPEIKRDHERKKYTANPEIKKSQEKKKYSANPEVKKAYAKVKYAVHPETKKAANQTYYYTRKEKFVTKRNILKKYRNLGRRRNTITLLGSVERYIKDLSAKINHKSKPQSRIEAEKIVKWCVQARRHLIQNMNKTLRNLKNRIDICLTQAAESTELDSKIAAICGASKHTDSSEAYYADTAYNELDIMVEPLITTTAGKIVNILPISTISMHVHKSWVCSEMCVEPDLDIINRMLHLLKAISSWKLTNIRNNLNQLNVCTVNKLGLKLGHLQSCYTNTTNCKSKLLPLQILQPHFPQIRYFMRQIYELRRQVARINHIDNALARSDLTTLKNLSVETAQKASTHHSHTETISSLNEDDLIAKHPLAFQALAKRSMDTPQLACLSCEKLCYRRDASDTRKLRKPLSGRYWSELQEYINHHDCTPTDFICHYCLEKFRNGELPPTCIMNQLAVNDMPIVLSALNDYEKILIQRAKAFQTVQRMGTVAKKNLPNKLRIQKVKGRTFHLPLPLEETLKKLPTPTDALNINHELFVLVMGIPNKSKIVWSNLVDVKKIYEALVWLKQNNPLYSEILLPADPELLLEPLTQDVEVQVESQQSFSQEYTDLPLESDKQETIRRKAMLTQIIDTEDYYEQYTIYPINADRKNNTATALYQMLKVHEAPLSTWAKYLDVMCFPDLYPYGINGQHQDRTVPLREFDYIKCRLMSKHSIFRLNQQYLFFLLHDSNIRQLKSGIFHKLNVINPKEQLNAERYLELMSEEKLEGNLTTVFARLRNTDQYWRKPRNDLACMVHNYGPATWFLTLSPSEWMWEDLATYIRQVNGPKMAHMSNSELVAADPVSASRYLDNKFHAMLDFICSADHPIGEVTHYFWRREYQGRGTQHFHLLIWIKDAPRIGESCIDEVSRFIAKYVTCKIPNKHVSPTLHRRVDTHQRHTHNNYCLRNKKTKTGYSKVCRFGFPRPITDSLLMRDVAVSIAGRKQLKSKSRLYDLPRSNEEAFINDYNPVVLTAWEGNMDIQFIGEKSTILMWYCTRYTTKSEVSNSAEMFDDINSTKSLSSRLWSVTTRSLNNRECGALEAADTLLGIALYGTDPDTTIKWLDVNQIRNRKLKPHKVVKKLDPRSTDIFYPSLIDDYYPNRPEELESLNLYDFARWYEVTRIKPVNDDIEIYELDNLYLKKRRRGYLINHYKYNVNVNPEKYFYALLLLFKPWRDTDELKSNCDSYAEAFELCKTELMEALKYHERLLDIQQGFEQVKELIENKMNDLVDKMSQLSQDCDENLHNPLGFEPIEAGRAMQEFNDVDKQIPEIDVNEMISQLNNDQKRIFNTITSALIAKNNSNTLRLFVSGAGGTGKSFLIKTIRSWTKQMLGKTTAVTAPTGLAAFNIDGMTVHRLFQLPVEHGGTPKYKELSDQVLKILRTDLKDVVLFIIDEVSMISNVTLTYIHLRLSEIFDTKNLPDGWFGGKHIIVLGDLLQLPPVNENSAFLDLSKDKIQKYLGSVGNINLWTHLFSYDELLINVRQQNDSTYEQILSRVRFGMLTTDDEQILRSRKIELVGKSVNDRLEELCDFINKLSVDTVCLFSTRNQCEILNLAMLAKVPGDEVELNAEDSVDCIPYLKKKISKLLSTENEDSSRTAGLAKTIIIKIGAKIMIRRNIDVSLGLVNGTIGQVTSITRAFDTPEVQSLTICLASGTEYTIERISTKFEIMNGAFIFRKQFPISLSYGITIHKSQGLTLNSAVMDIGNSLFTSGQAYVALSRVRSLEGLYLINLDPYSFKVQESAIIEYNRLRRLYRPELAEINLLHIRNPKVKDTLWSIPLHICDTQIEEHNTALHDHLPAIVGLDNIDGVACYANASLQAIFHCPSILHELTKMNNNNPLEILAHSYIENKTKLNSLAVREFADERFKEKMQQDAAEFIMALCQQSDITRTAIEHELITHIRCNNCGLSSENKQPNQIIAIPVTFEAGIKCPKNLQDLINVSFSRWTRINSICKNCRKYNKLQKTIITWVKDIVILQLMLFSYKDGQSTKITNFKVNAIPTTKITLDDKQFKVHSAIFHHGLNLDHGHYSAMLKDKKNNWLNVSDMNVRKMIWPRGARDAYIYVLKRI